MKKVICLTVLCFLFVTGCDILEYPLTNINGWNLSACVDGYETCWNLFWDNSDLIFGGGDAIIQNLPPQ